jgi:3-oxoacyl-[acyl-carrier protein] reductase
MDLGLKGKRALVTGASSGLGAAAALALVSEGAKVTIVARDEERLQEAADKIAGIAGCKPAISVADITKPGDIDRLSKQAEPVDILICNGGGPPPGDFLSLDDVAFAEANELLLGSATRLTRKFLPGMKERGWGRLVYITSISVLQPIDDLLLSNVFRAGVYALAKTLSNTYARFGITANVVCPGFTRTERLTELAESRGKATGSSTQEMFKQFAADIPAARLGEPDELASLIAFLASDRAAYITGTAIPVDGGMARGL